MTGGPSLTARIRSEIEARILSGDWPPGHRIPFESELSALYGCSRMTVNKALAGLAAAGLIERRRRAGSFVAAPARQSAVLQIPDIPAEIAARGARYGLVLVARRERRAGAGDPPGAGFAPGQPLLDLTCRHLADGRPFAQEERLISLAAVPAAAEVDFSAVPPGTWLLRHVPWTEASHRITALNAPGALARALDLPPGGACLAVERRTWRGEDTVTYVRQIFRGDAYSLGARFSP
ncbi:transcriptional regulator, histidine utilization repressor, GntR family [Methylobacterium sp. 4-46]|uniref:histidine utilization repressor n=1 Tax=unclassified Methylobacterium TaxID=2615210 RepID=UPI000165C630|nr:MULTISPECIES: histidine utilization repressor [Methylobacterium]ACA16149.1 transcriptional regulator, histidine utilization repressor, GntR family [Methylobacterium sp. 4-46]WFT81858.1 histidine utilization repressor [Methylobacterium nodulans]